MIQNKTKTNGLFTLHLGTFKCHMTCAIHLKVTNKAWKKHRKGELVKKICELNWSIKILGKEEFLKGVFHLLQIFLFQVFLKPWITEVRIYGVKHDVL